ncbi:MAG TPA: RHS repeat domain-containing protein, partial [Niastella sp.]
VGIPNISIPLYEIRMGDLTLPITLSYHSSGMKPKEHGGRVAKGWALKAEPAVSRSIKGIADDATSPYLESGYFEKNNRPAIPIFDLWEREKEMVRRYIDKEWDMESDVYYYDLNPGGGKAYANYSPGGSAIHLVTYPRTNDIVLCNRVNTISNFEVITAQGVKYQFGNNSYTKERWGNDVTRWMCNRITSAKTNAEITFSYYPAPGNMLNPNNYWQMNHTLIIEDSIDIRSGPYPQTILTEQVDGHNTEWYLISPTQKQSYYNPDRNYLGSSTYDHPQTIDVSELQTIYFGQNRVEFNYNNDGLSKIRVVGAEGETIRTIDLFTANYNVNTTHRKLDSIRISAPGCESRVYAFKYYGEAMVPALTTFGIDHWGYSNGPGNGQLTVPTIKTMTAFHNYPASETRYHEIPGANREPDHEYTKAGILYEVTNPDGVVTNFEYAGNSGAFLMYYRGSNPENHHYRHPVGGLRVQRITTTDPLTGKVYWRLFEYGLELPGNYGDVSPIWGGGAIKHIVTDRDYCWVRRQQIGDYRGDAQRTSRIRSWGSMPIAEITFNNGSPVMYNIVRESQYGPDEPQVLKTQYRYSVTYHNWNDIFLWDHYNADYPQVLPLDYVYNSTQQAATRKSIYAPYDINDTDHGGAYSDVFDGQLEKKEIFRNDTLIASTEYLYEEKYNQLNGARAVVVNRPFRSTAFFPDPYDTQGAQHKMQRDEFVSGYSSTPQATWNMATTYWKALVKETNNQYDYSSGQLSVLTTVKDHLYPEYNINPYKSTTQSSSQQAIEDDFDYNSDYRDILSYHKRSKGGLFTESRIEFVSGIRPSVVKHRTSLMPAFQDQVTYHAYDDFGNVAEVSSKDGVHTVYIWGYNNQYLLAEIVNMTYAELRANHITDPAYIRDLGNRPRPNPYDLDLLNSFRTAMPNSLVTTYTYKPLTGLTSVTDPNGQTIYYEHDAYGRLTEKYRIENGIKKILELVDYSFAR